MNVQSWTSRTDRTIRTNIIIGTSRMSRNRRRRRRSGRTGRVWSIHLDAPFPLILFSILLYNDDIYWFSNTFFFVDFITTGSVDNMLNMELDLKSLFELLCTAAVLSGWAPATPSLTPHLGSHTRALLVSQDRRHLFVTSCRRFIRDKGEHWKTTKYSVNCKM